MSLYDFGCGRQWSGTPFSLTKYLVYCLHLPRPSLYPVEHRKPPLLSLYFIPVNVFVVFVWETFRKRDVDVVFVVHRLLTHLVGSIFSQYTFSHSCHILYFLWCVNVCVWKGVCVCLKVKWRLWTPSDCVKQDTFNLMMVCFMAYLEGLCSLQFTISILSLDEIK